MADTEQPGDLVWLPGTTQPRTNYCFLPSVGPPLADIKSAYLQSIQGVIFMMTLPVHLMATAAEQEAFSRRVTAERILLVPDVSSGKLQAETADEIALRRASEEFANCPDEERETVMRQADERLLTLVTRSSDVATGCRELLRQSLVMSWSAYEVLAQQLFAALLNAKPELVLRLEDHERAKRVFQLKGVSFESLHRFGFDLSSRLGDYLVEYGSLKSAARIADVFDGLFPDSYDLRQALSSKALRMLNLRRNLVVHRRGIVDSEYILAAGETCEVGARLSIGAQYVSECVDLLLSIGSPLFNAAQAEIGPLKDAS